MPLPSQIITKTSEIDQSLVKINSQPSSDLDFDLVFNFPTVGDMNLGGFSSLLYITPWKWLSSEFSLTPVAIPALPIDDEQDFALACPTISDSANPAAAILTVNTGMKLNFRRVDIGSTPQLTYLEEFQIEFDDPLVEGGLYFTAGYSVATGDFYLIGQKSDLVTALIIIRHNVGSSAVTYQVVNFPDLDYLDITTQIFQGPDSSGQILTVWYDGTDYFLVYVGTQPSSTLDPIYKNSLAVKDAIPLSCFSPCRNFLIRERLLK